MKILHVVPHLGAAIGKVHSTLCSARSAVIERSYVLLETPRDIRHVDAIRQLGVSVVVEADHQAVSSMVASADIVQIEWWNHPSLFQCLCKTAWPRMRMLVWSHVQGISAPYIPTGLIIGSDSFVFSSESSFAAPNVHALDPREKSKLRVIESGVGVPSRNVKPARHRKTAMGCLGRADLSKIDRDIFQVADEPRTAAGSQEYCAEAFERTYADIVRRPKRQIDFRPLLGNTAADWFLAAQFADGPRPENAKFRTGGRAIKGTLDHFLDWFPEDPSLAPLIVSDTRLEPANGEACA